MEEAFPPFLLQLAEGTAAKTPSLPVGLGAGAAKLPSRACPAHRIVLGGEAGDEGMSPAQVQELAQEDPAEQS